jgi:hypothetical protein
MTEAGKLLIAAGVGAVLMAIVEGRYSAVGGTGGRMHLVDRWTGQVRLFCYAQECWETRTRPYPTGTGGGEPR